MVMVPQVGTQQQVTLPHQMPDTDYCKNLEPLGWIHTQSNEPMHLAPQDTITHSKLLMNNELWDAETAVVITLSFTPGSCSLTGYKVTSQGYDWGKANKDTLQNSQGYNITMYEKTQLLLSDRFSGFFMVPDNHIWNYNFIGLGVVPNMKYSLILANPRDFYHEIHRTSHFIKFIKQEEDSHDSALPDQEDPFS